MKRTAREIGIARAALIVTGAGLVTETLGAVVSDLDRGRPIFVLVEQVG